MFGIFISVRMYLGSCLPNLSGMASGMAGISVRWLAMMRTGSMGKLMFRFSSHLVTASVARSN